MRAWTLALALVAGCFNDTGPVGSVCEQGQSGCPCYGNATCNEDFECSPQRYCIDPDCQDGVQDCPCYGNGTCDPGLTCLDGAVCKPPVQGGGSTSGAGTTVGTTSAGPTSGPGTTDAMTSTSADPATTDMPTGGSTGTGSCEACPTGHCVGSQCARYIFVSQSPIDGGFGGLAAADSLCAEEASKLGLPGAYVVVAGDSKESPFAHAQLGADTSIDAIFVLPGADAVVVASSTEALGSGGSATLQHPIDRDAAGNPVEPGAGPNCVSNVADRVWTGLGADGDVGQSCTADWSLAAGDGGTGRFTQTDIRWISAANCPCVASDGKEVLSTAYLYCVEVPNQ